MGEGKIWDQGHKFLPQLKGQVRGPRVSGGSWDGEQEMDVRDKNGPGESVELGKSLTLGSREGNVLGASSPGLGACGGRVEVPLHI